MIQIICTDYEYLIALPYAERSRAKRIAGYVWDSSQRLWRFPKNERSRKGIMAEFGPEETEWTIGDGRAITPATLEARLATNEAHLRELEDIIQLQEELQSNYEIVIDLWNTAEHYGFPEDRELDELVLFTKAAYEGNYRHADLAVQVATTKAKLHAADRELAELRRGTGSEGQDRFTQTLVQVAWGNSTMPQVIRDFSFDGRGAIELQNYLSKMLSRDLARRTDGGAFADLIREAEDAGILSSGAARVCHTLRIQRNVFAHESVDSADTLSRAALCLFSFVIVYRELVQRRGAL